jgi:hypothetical protein
MWPVWNVLEACEVAVAVVCEAVKVVRMMKICRIRHSN